MVRGTGPIGMSITSGLDMLGNLAATRVRGQELASAHWKFEPSGSIELKTDIGNASDIIRRDEIALQRHKMEMDHQIMEYEHLGACDKSKEIADLKAENAQLKAENAQLKTDNAQLQAELVHCKSWMSAAFHRCMGMGFDLNAMLSGQAAAPVAVGPVALGAAAPAAAVVVDDDDDDVPHPHVKRESPFKKRKSPIKIKREPGY